MRLYLAGHWTPSIYEWAADQTGARDFLFSYAHKEAQKCAVHFAARPDMRVLIDSGAFTAWKSGKPIVFDDYIRFAKELRAKARCQLTFVALDVIPGIYKGRAADAAELERCCQQGFDNYLAMRANGIPCLPTFHRDDPWKWLDKIIDDVMATETNHMCLAPKVDGAPRRVKMKWLNKCYQHIHERGLLETLKIHGLGVASPVMMETYPFYSVDSTAWLQGAKRSAYRYWDGSEAPLVDPSEWESRAAESQPIYDSASDPSCLQGTFRYRKRGEGSKDHEFGSYWFGKHAIKQDVQLQKYITAHWEYRGVTWDEPQACEAFEPEAGTVAANR